MIAAIAGRFADQGQRRIDRYAGWQSVVEHMRDDWANGRRPAISQLQGYVARVGIEHHSGVLEDLIAAHLRLSWQDGSGSKLEEYLEEFGPHFDRLASPATVPADLVEDEFLARFQAPHGDSPSLEEYAVRFGGRDDVMKLLRDRCLDSGRYVKLRIRGQGAMGTVFEAFDRHLCRRVAIKEPKLSHAATDDHIGHFAHEARMTAGLDHPGIVSVHEYLGTSFYVMRLVDGRTLGECIRDYHSPPRDRVATDQRLLWIRLIQSFLAVCDAMSFAHARGVIHRDLKPGNIVVGEFGETVILDWGMGKQIARIHGSMVVGTPQYMPPEQADGCADVRSDVFGLGAILYEILTARPPHAWPEGFRPAAWLQRVREAQFDPPRRIKPKSPWTLQAICLKALASDPTHRYQSATELADDIRRAMAGEPIRASAEPFVIRLKRWFRGRA